jgi:hypothetical protein
MKPRYKIFFHVPKEYDRSLFDNDWNSTKFLSSQTVQEDENRSVISYQLTLNHRNAQIHSHILCEITCSSEHWSPDYAPDYDGVIWFFDESTKSSLSKDFIREYNKEYGYSKIPQVLCGARKALNSADLEVLERWNGDILSILYFEGSDCENKLDLPFLSIINRILLSI